uniref:hypothetical protein n=1 Tax=Nocardiopsis halotolerans TaxID=124252 RepID=UPI001F4C9D2A
IRRQNQRPLPSPRRNALEQAKSLPHTRTAVSETERPRPGSAPVVARHTRPVPGPVRIPHPRHPHPSEQGWCVDDDGVRGVRPYLFHDPSRRPRRLERVEAEPGEFDELASAVRTWLDTRR